MLHLVLPSLISLLVSGSSLTGHGSVEASVEETVAGADEDGAAGLGFAAEVDVRSRYLYDGLPYSEGPVVQPWMALDYAPGSLWVFANVGLPHRGEAAVLDEIDVGVDLDWELGAFALGFGAMGLFAPGGAPSAELTLELAWTREWLTLSHEYGVDVAALAGGQHGEGAVGGAFELGDTALETRAWTTWASAPYASENAGVERAAVLGVGVDAALTIAVSDVFYVRPHLAVGALPDAAVRRSFGETFVTDIGLAVGGGI